MREHVPPHICRRSSGAWRSVKFSTPDLEAGVDQGPYGDLGHAARVGELVAESTSEVAGSALDLARRQAVAVDTVKSK